MHIIFGYVLYYPVSVDTASLHISHALLKVWNEKDSSDCFTFHIKMFTMFCFLLSCVWFVYMHKVWPNVYLGVQPAIG